MGEFRNWTAAQAGGEKASGRSEKYNPGARDLVNRHLRHHPLEANVEEGWSLCERAVGGELDTWGVIGSSYKMGAVLNTSKVMAR